MNFLKYLVKSKKLWTWFVLIGVRKLSTAHALSSKGYILPTIYPKYSISIFRKTYSNLYLAMFTIFKISYSFCTTSFASCEGTKSPKKVKIEPFAINSWKVALIGTLQINYKGQTRLSKICNMHLA